MSITTYNKTENIKYNIDEISLDLIFEYKRIFLYRPPILNIRKWTIIISINKPIFQNADIESNTFLFVVNSTITLKESKLTNNNRDKISIEFKPGCSDLGRNFLFKL
jgi:hypothetical protein